MRRKFSNTTISVFPSHKLWYPDSTILSWQSRCSSRLCYPDSANVIVTLRQYPSDFLSQQTSHCSSIAARNTRLVTWENKIVCSTANTLHRRNVCICAPEIVYLFIFRPRIPSPAALCLKSWILTSPPPADPSTWHSHYLRDPRLRAREPPQRTTIFMCSVATIGIIYAFYIWKSRPLCRPWSLVFLTPKLLLFDDWLNNISVIKISSRTFSTRRGVMSNLCVFLPNEYF